MKILLTGGHLTPALALIDYLKVHLPEAELVFVGREYAQSNRQKAHERTEVQERNVPFFPIHSGKLGFANPVQLIGQSFRIIAATITSFVILLKLKPDICVSFGSYLAVPVTLAAWVLRIPVLTHEQTKTAGFANRVIGLMAKKIAIAYPESVPFFPRKKTLLTGNLVRERVLTQSNTKPEWITNKTVLPILYITGGSQGSEIINSTISQSLKRLLKGWCIIHQCGNPSAHRDYAAELRLSAAQLPSSLQQRYYVREWISDSDLAWIYTHATAIISRAGANSVEEIALRGIPAILIPLPFSLRDEQLHNALALSEKGQAMLLPQKDLNPETLLLTISQLTKKSRSIKESLSDYVSDSKTALPTVTKLITEIV